MNTQQNFSKKIPLQGESPGDCISRIKSLSHRKTTPCGSGEMVWNIWGSGTPIILLHGNFGSWPHWIRNIPVLSKKYALYIPDLPGFGESDLPPQPYSVDKIIEIVIKGINELMPLKPNVHISGFSYGSTMAGLLAKVLNERVLSLCLCGGSRLAGMQDLPRDFINWRKASNHKELLAAHRHNLGVAMFRSHEAVDDLAVSIQAMIAPMGRIKPREFLQPDALLPALKKVKAPMLTIWGVSDPYFPFLKKKWNDTVVANGLNLKRVDVEYASHWAIYEQSDVVNEHLLAWYDLHDKK